MSHTEFDLQCQTCDHVIIGRDTRQETMNVARAAGWHIYIGDNYVRTSTMDVVLCGDCVGSPRVRRERGWRKLEGDQTLW